MASSQSNSFANSEPTENNQLQTRIYQLLSIIEPIILNDENVIKALNTGLIDTFSEMLVFQS